LRESGQTFLAVFRHNLNTAAKGTKAPEHFLYIDIFIHPFLLRQEMARTVPRGP
jgi:hypothetical protein